MGCCLEFETGNQYTSNNQSGGYRYIGLLGHQEFYLNIEDAPCIAITCNIAMMKLSLPPEFAHLVKTIVVSIMRHKFFVFNGQAYQQKRGVFMGCQAACQLANISAWHYEVNEKGLADCSAIRLYMRYLDDGFIIWRDSEGRRKSWEIIGDRWTS